jgi:hypothetical protein
MVFTVAVIDVATFRSVEQFARAITLGWSYEQFKWLIALQLCDVCLV